MINNIYNAKTVKVVCVLTLFLLCSLLCFFSFQSAETSSASASSFVSSVDFVNADYVLKPMSGGEATTQALNDSATVTFTVFPLNCNQGCTWNLVWDMEKMKDFSPVAFNEINTDASMVVSKYLGMSINGNKCTVTALKYYKFAFRVYPICLKLIATSVLDTSFSAVCSIQLG